MGIFFSSAKRPNSPYRVLPKVFVWFVKVQVAVARTAPRFAFSARQQQARHRAEGSGGWKYNPSWGEHRDHRD